MARDAEAAAAAKVISDVGKRLAQQTRLNKDSLVKLLRKAEDAFPALGQSSALKSSIDPLSTSLVQNNLLHHRDKDVRVLVASCFCQIIRVLAPDPPYSDEILKDIFKLIVSMFSELSDTESPYFIRRVKILETVARLKCCLLMLDVGCDDLVLEMFTIFFSIVSDHHQPSLIHDMRSIMTLILEEKVSQPLLDVILRNLLNGKEAAPSASSQLAVSIIQHSTEKLEPVVQAFLTSCILDRDAVPSDLKEYYHEIILEVYKCAPQMLLLVLPNLTQELLTDQVDARIKAVNLLGKLFASSEYHVAREYRQLFVEFLKRFSDKSAGVRVSTLQCALACYLSNPSASESREVLAAVEGRLLDFDDKVRTQAVITLCDLAMSKLKSTPGELIIRVTERLRDKKVSVRKCTMQKLLELYRVYCSKCAEGLVTLCEQFENIPCKILMLCYDKDCKEFRPYNMELVLAEELFPASLSVEERTKHWVFFFSYFTLAHTKALNSILSQKWRLQTEMQVYLALKRKEKETSLEEVQKRMRISFKKMSTSFENPSKAEEWFETLNQMKDNSIFKDLLQLLDAGIDPRTSCTLRESFLKKIGHKHTLREFFRILSAKCSYNIFCAENVLCILSDLSRTSGENKHLDASSINLLMTITTVFPSLLRGSEEHLQSLFLVENNHSKDKLLQILAKAGPHLSIKLSDIYPALERVCMEGTRLQSKHAVSAIVAINGTSDPLVFSDLYEKLVDSLQSGQNVPTVLQSLGCIAQHSISTYESREEEITFVIQNIFQETDVKFLNELTPFDEDSGCTSVCKLKIYGLKTLVKSFIPHQGTQVRHQIRELFHMLLKILPDGDVSDDIISSVVDKANIKLAAAKAVLRLARKWDLHISPHIFHLAIQKAKDPSSLVRKLFLVKLQKLLKERAVPSRYACAFALGASDCFKDVQVDSMKYMAEFIKEYSNDARNRLSSQIQDVGGTMTSYPEYIVVYLIHILAHDVDFPSVDCEDEEVYARFCSPLVVFLQAVVNFNVVDRSKSVITDSYSYMLSIFHAIRMAEDATDVHITHKLHILAGIGMLILKALNCDGISTSHSPARILLPSSFYKVRFDQKIDEASPHILTGLPLDENLVNRILHAFKLKITEQPTCSQLKRGKNHQEESFQLDGVMHNRMNLPRPRQADLLKSRTKEDNENPRFQGVETGETMRQKVVASNKTKRPSPGTASRAMELLKESSAATDHMKQNKIPETNWGKEQISSCGSVITKPSLSESHVLTQGGDLAEVKRPSSRITTECCNVFNVNSGNNCKSKVGDMNDTLIGRRIKLWSPIDKCYFSGTVDEFNSQNSYHKVTYDSGEIELLHLSDENWQIVTDVSSPTEDGDWFPADKRKLQDLCGEPVSSLSSIDITDAFGDKDSQPRKASPTKHDNQSGRIPTVEGAGKEKKRRQKVSASEVIDVKVDAIARRTRSRKA